MTFSGRRLRNMLIVFLAAVGLLLIHNVFRAALYQEQFLSGWVLFASALILTAYNARKKITVLPIGSSASWLQVHIYLGLLSILLFLLHISWRIPNGWLESLLAIFFVGVALSGLIGLYLSRRLSKLLTRSGEELIFERIPGFVSELRDEAEKLVVECAATTGSPTISEYHAAHLAHFFSGPKNSLRHLLGSNRHLFEMVKQITNMDRYLNDVERKFAERLNHLTEKKNELDYQYALQAVLKGWLFIHIPLTYGMLLLATMHLVLAYAFSGGL